MLGGADPVGVDRLHMVLVGLAAPAEQELLGCRPPLRHHVVRCRRSTVVNGCRLRNDRHHLSREPGQIVPGLLVVDVDHLLQAPHARKASGLGLKVGRSVAAQARGLVRLGVGHPRHEAPVHEQSPNLLVAV